MDPLTQGVVGATASRIVAHPKEKPLAVVLGFLSGMAADLDVLIRSSNDPLLALEYHRQFTHSLVFIPLAALVCALVFFYLFLRQRLSFRHTYLYCFVGYATHALLDACTTYGTLLFWPFSNSRIAWNNVSVVDPLFTLPLLFLLILSLRKNAHGWVIFSVIYAFSYLALGVIQNQRATKLAYELAISRGHQAINLSVKPSFANLIVWKSVYEYGGRYYVDAVRVLNDNKTIPGTSVEKLNLAKHFPWLKQNTQQALDVDRFAWFSNQHLALDPSDPKRIIDLRYSLIPNQVNGMWGIVLDPLAAPQQHVKWTTTRPKADFAVNIKPLWTMIFKP